MSIDAVQERDYFIAWIQFAICNALGGAIAGAVAGGLVGMVIGPHHLNPKVFMLATAGAGFVASLPVSYFFFRLFVSRLWFRIHAANSQVPPLPVNAA